MESRCPRCESHCIGQMQTIADDGPGCGRRAAAGVLTRRPESRHPFPPTPWERARRRAGSNPRGSPRFGGLRAPTGSLGLATSPVPVEVARSRCRASACIVARRDGRGRPRRYGSLNDQSGRSAVCLPLPAIPPLGDGGSGVGGAPRMRDGHHQECCAKGASCGSWGVRHLILTAPSVSVRRISGTSSGRGPPSNRCPGLRLGGPGMRRDHAGCPL